MEDPFVTPKTPSIDPDKQCAVSLRRGGRSQRCTVGLSCKIHSEAQKRAVTDRSRGYDELLAQQSRFTNLPKQYAPPQTTPAVLDLDVQCGVVISSGKVCRMNLRCRSHDLEQRKAVVGRTADLDFLLQRTSPDTDTQCSVLLPNGRNCTHFLGCTQHKIAAKRAVLRSADLKVLIGLQKEAGTIRKPKTKTEGELEKKRVRDLINTTMNKEFAIVYPDKEDPERGVDMAKAYRHLKRINIDPDSGTYEWEDAYSFQPITVSSRGLSCSFEAEKPMVWHNGIPREHIFSNTVLTTEYANKLCDSYPSIALRVLYELDAAACPRIRAQLVERLDHLHLIRSQIPWSTAKRLALRCEPGFMEEFTAQCYTGVATLSGCAYIARHSPIGESHTWKITAHHTRAKGPSVTDDECANLDEVRQFITDLEVASQTPFPRVNDVPYPFQGGPNPAAWSWTLLYQVAQYRLVRLRKICNSRHPTAFDTPRLICAIFYLIRYGRQAQPTALLNVPVSIYTRNLLRMSVGKADHSREMTSGFTPHGPITFANFNVNECNLCVEPWPCNNAKGNVDSQVDTIRDHFRNFFRFNNPRLWSENFVPLDDNVTTRYIRNGLVSLDEDDEETDTENIGSPETGSERSEHRSATSSVGTLPDQRKRNSPDGSTSAPETQQVRVSNLVVRDTGSPGHTSAADSLESGTLLESLDEENGSRKSSRGEYFTDVSNARRDGQLRKQLTELETENVQMKLKLEEAQKRLRTLELQYDALLAEQKALLEGYY